MFHEIIYLIVFTTLVTLIGVTGVLLYYRPTKQALKEFLRLGNKENYVKNWEYNEVDIFLFELASKKLSIAPIGSEAPSEIRNDCKVYFLIEGVRMSLYYSITVYPRELDNVCVKLFLSQTHVMEGKISSDYNNRDVEIEKIAYFLGKKPWEVGIILKDERRIQKLRNDFIIRIAKSII